MHGYTVMSYLLILLKHVHAHVPIRCFSVLTSYVHTCSRTGKTCPAKTVRFKQHCQLGDDVFPQANSNPENQRNRHFSLMFLHSRISSGMRELLILSSSCVEQGSRRMLLVQAYQIAAQKLATVSWSSREELLICSSSSVKQSPRLTHTYLTRPNNCFSKACNRFVVKPRGTAYFFIFVCRTELTENAVGSAADVESFGHVVPTLYRASPL